MTMNDINIPHEKSRWKRGEMVRCGRSEKRIRPFQLPLCLWAITRHASDLLLNIEPMTLLRAMHLPVLPSIGSKRRQQADWIEWIAISFWREGQEKQ